jgi:hypothetical protein
MIKIGIFHVIDIFYYSYSQYFSINTGGLRTEVEPLQLVFKISVYLINISSNSRSLKSK